MPNGYTSEIYDGTNTDPADYLRRVARAFGAYIHFRDSAITDRLPELPTTLPEDAYERRSLAEAEAELARLRGLTEPEAIAEFERDRERFTIDVAKAERKTAEMRARYQSVLDAVNDFEAPTDDHVEYVRTVKRYLTESMEFDCGYSPRLPYPHTGFISWWDAALNEAERRVQYAQRSLAEAIQRAEERYAWSKALTDAIDAFEDRRAARAT
jgi:hypothetical protein